LASSAGVIEAEGTRHQPTKRILLIVLQLGMPRLQFLLQSIHVDARSDGLGNQAVIRLFFLFDKRRYLACQHFNLGLSQFGIATAQKIIQQQLDEIAFDLRLLKQLFVCTRIERFRFQNFFFKNRMWNPSSGNLVHNSGALIRILRARGEYQLNFAMLRLE